MAEKNAALNEVMKKDQKSWTPADKKLLTRIASNWGDTKKPEQEGYMHIFEGSALRVIGMPLLE
ncbi:hypothetical protein Ctob_015186 [Chrysochromulina tobinii]|uniref:Uncharacterized protein n=1 Tax=Chrysochromulina tobinii TaxID=1460289 RepID=A0A0M0JYV8_9EUKA|nr:hypothetical protein Ctob_015186 [Chrysochromulina tobinii]|eukprot:KOO31745.1 hypothetical protein Ctob_015186 [Chrysochromulina sp. CCMP291]